MTTAFAELLASLPETTLDGALHLRAQERPDHPALVTDGRQLTYAQLDAAVDRLAGHLRTLGLAPGQQLVAFPTRSWHLPVMFLATVRAGGVFAPLDRRGDPTRLEPILRMNTALAWVPNEDESLARRVARVLGNPDGVIRSAGANSIESMLDIPCDGPGPSQDAQAVCYINFTSGSTGRPKGAPTTHANVQWNTRACVETHGFRQSERYLCLFAPFAHPHEHWARPLVIGATCVMVDSLRPRTVLKSMGEHDVTWLFAIPSVFELLLRAAESGAPVPDSLYRCESGGAVVLPELVRRAEDAFACPLIPIWGCTESTGVVLHVPATADRRLEMLGKAVAHYDVRVDAPDRDTGIGELCVRGPAVVTGYRDRPEQNRSRFRGGWYFTGDLVKAEADGWLRFMGRREEMIKVSGEKVYLQRIERVIDDLPGVAQVVVVPATDPSRGEVPRAVIVLDPDAHITRDDVLRHCRAHLNAAHLPRRVEFWDEIPAGPSGKVDKRAVAERVTHELALGVNSMLFADRSLDEVFDVSGRLAKRLPIPVVVDLRSRRDPKSDPDGTWAIAHSNSDFDLGDRASVARAVRMARDAGVQIMGASAYIGACHPGDVEYGERLIDNAYELAEAAPEGTILLRVLGGNLWARARSMPGRWQDIRRTLRDESLATIQRWEAHTRRRAAESSRKVVLGLELHHGQYLSELHDIHHCCRGMREVGWDFVGFIEDPANRFIASEGDLLGAMDFARMVRAWGGRILGYHLKDVRYLSPWSQFHPQPLQRIGDKVFVWGMHKFEWTALGEGELDLPQVLMAARTQSEPVHPFCPVSAEYVAASRDAEDAEHVLRSYARLIRDQA